MPGPHHPHVKEMANMKWLSEYELGIQSIDDQHRRIVEYINELEKAHAGTNNGYKTYVLEGLLDYTLTHFDFEEQLQERAGYPFLKAHKRIHEIFRKRVTAFRERAAQGEDITEELLFMLKTWLASHIKGDDRDYGDLVRNMIAEPENAHLA
jgi:hemerythrin